MIIYPTKEVALTISGQVPAGHDHITRMWAITNTRIYMNTNKGLSVL